MTYRCTDPVLNEQQPKFSITNNYNEILVGSRVLWLSKYFINRKKYRTWVSFELVHGVSVMNCRHECQMEFYSFNANSRIFNVRIAASHIAGRN